MIYPLLPIFLTATLAATPLAVGMIEASAEALSAILKLISGSWSDRTPRRKPFIVVGYLVAALSRIAIATAGMWQIVLGARLLDRTGKGIRSAPRDALISDVTPPEERGRAFGFHRALDHTGAVIGPLLATLLLAVTAIDIRTLFLLAVIPGVMGVILLAVALKEEPRELPPAQEKGAVREPLPRRFWVAMSSIALFCLANSSDVFLILQASAAGVPHKFIPLLWAAHHVVKSLFSAKAGAFSDRTDRRNLLIAGWLFYAVIYLLFPYARSTPAFLALFVLYAVPFTLAEGAERAWVSTLVPGHVRGKSFGIYYLVFGAFTLLGTALFGLLFQEVSPRAAFHTGAAIAAAAAFSVALQKRQTSAG